MFSYTPVVSFSEGVAGGYNGIASDESIAVCETAVSYRPRNPEDNPLYGIVSKNLETFLSRQDERGRTVPRFVERELRSFLDCGVLANGFIRVHCDDCGKDRVVAFSCKGRSLCSSCCGRRMTDTAAHLVDRVFPEVPVRQWVLSFPFALRYRLAYDSALLRDVLHIFIQAVFSSLRRRARESKGIHKAKCGGVTFIQRFGGAINLNIHLHSLIVDGVYHMDARQNIQFQRLPKPSDSEVAWVMERVVKRVARLLERRGLGPQSDPEDVDPLLQEQPLLAELYSASVQGRIATGHRAGNRVAVMGVEVEPERDGIKRKSACADKSGFSLHANVGIPAKARHQLENLCRYVARPAVAMERLFILPDGRVAYSLRHKWRDGTTHVLFEPLELLEKLAALVPPPRFNLVRYSGIFAPASPWRSQIVPFNLEESGKPVHHHGCKGKEQNGTPANKDFHKSAQCHPRNYTWAELMKRVWDVDVLKCPGCGGKMRILCAITAPDAIMKILDCLGLPSRPPPIYPAIQDSYPVD